MLNERFSNWLRHWPTGTATNFSDDLSFALATDLGLKREQNQDRVAALGVGPSSGGEAFLVVAVADGMGGMSDGFECAVRTISYFFDAVLRFQNYPTPELLRVAAIDANRAVYRYARSRGGATLSAVILKESGSYTVNVGDSRIYARRDSRNQQPVVRLTVDDNLEEAIGGVGRELLQFIGMGPGLAPHINECPVSVDRLLLTTDGVHFINQSVLSEIFAYSSPIADVTKQLLTFSRWRGSPDNASLALVDIPEVIKWLRESPSSFLTLFDPFGAVEFIVEANERDISQVRDQPFRPPPLPTPPPSAKPVVKRQRRNRNAPSRKKEEPDSEQLSIEIDSSPDPLNGKEENNK